MPPTESRADDPAALVAECHRPEESIYEGGITRCLWTQEAWPCREYLLAENARLADALDLAQRRARLWCQLAVRILEVYHVNSARRPFHDKPFSECTELLCVNYRREIAKLSDVGEGPISTDELIEAAKEWQDVVSGKLTIPPKAYLDAENRLSTAVENYRKATGDDPA